MNILYLNTILFFSYSFHNHLRFTYVLNNNNCFCTNDRYMSKVKNTNIRTLVICPILSLLMYGRWQWIDSTTKIISPSFLAYPIFEWQISYWLSMCIYHYSSLPFASFITAHDPFYSFDIHIILLLSFKLVTISLSFFYKWYETIMHKQKNISWINDEGTPR